MSLFSDKHLDKFKEKLAKELLEKESNKDSEILTRNQAIEDLESGEAAKRFVEDLKKFATNEKGEKLKVSPWLEEYARLIADSRISETYTSGSAQIGKTLLHAILQAWLVIECRLNILYVFAQERALQKMVAIQMRPILQAWLQARGEKLSKGTQNNTLYQVGGGQAIYSYVSTNKSTRGTAAAGSSIVSFSVDFAFCDERSQYPPGAADPVYRRLDAGRLSSKPIRLVGTPGSGLGIEQEISKADYHFYPHVRCPACGETTSLHPFGALLKPLEKKNERGEVEIRFLSESGKPESWYHTNSEDPVSTAYFACTKCSAKLDDETRRNAHFICLNSGKNLVDFLDNFENPNGKKYKVGIVLSPLLRESNLNLAAEIIQSGLDSSNTQDWAQQRLGLPSQGDDASLTLEQIKRAIFAPEPSINPRQKRLILGGVDQGRSFDYLCLIEYILPLDQARLSAEQIVEKTIRNVLFASAITRAEIPETIRKYGCSTGIIDNEPNITTAAELAREIGWQLADQKPKQKDAAKKVTVRDGGQEFDCWSIRNGRFLRAVKNMFVINYSDGYPLARLPKHWEKWLYNPTELSPVKHLTALSYNSNTGLFERPQDHNDDLYYAFAFAEAAFYLEIASSGAYPKWLRLV